MIGRAKVPHARLVAGALLLTISTLAGCRQSAPGGAESDVEPGPSDASQAPISPPVSESEAVAPAPQPIEHAHGTSAGEGRALDPVAIPAETIIPAVMEGLLSTGLHTPGDTFHARVVEEILAPDGMVLVPEGARISGRTVEVSQLSSGGETPSVSLTFELLEIDGATVPLDGVAELTSTKDPNGSVPRVILKDGQAVVPEGTPLLVRLRSPSVLLGR